MKTHLLVEKQAQLVQFEEKLDELDREDSGDQDTNEIRHRIIFDIKDELYFQRREKLLGKI